MIIQIESLDNLVIMSIGRKVDKDQKKKHLVMTVLNKNFKKMYFKLQIVVKIILF